MQLYRCQECNNRYYNGDQYVQHIQRDHKKSTLNNLVSEQFEDLTNYYIFIN